ncbi:glycerophosphodiester phosphodiesterase family protein [Oceaniglobus trochenteri]|uniref:glycerophosphodiester phosphodiesterase family protein n=1 Tax=Oceaniglobus trochenteri TaxID=2763260 RepID=UPI001CFF7894|nr:glycerophosphodiester phosphodiesterase family protein [Oceaniglobus trochenteri]
MTTLPAEFLGAPIAHRGLHDVAAGRPENSLAAFRAAIAAGYGIELDVQRSADDGAMVFHDYDLDRVTEASGLLRDRSADALGRIALRGGDEGIPTLAQVCDLVAGQVPLLVEIKDQDGALGPDVGPLERAVADVLRDYRGPLAVMSFNPHAVAVMGEYLPGVARGLTTCDFDAADWPLPEPALERLRDIPDFDRTGACFISHDRKDLSRPRVAELKRKGVPVLCWTVKSPEAETKARRVADNITFEGYIPPVA